MLSASRGGATATFGYDMAGRKKSMSDPDLGNWGYTYDGTGSLASQTDARSCATSLGYDSLNRLVSKSYSNCPTTSSVTYTYDDDVYAEAFSGGQPACRVGQPGKRHLLWRRGDLGRQWELE